MVSISTHDKICGIFSRCYQLIRDIWKTERVLLTDVYTTRILNRKANVVIIFLNILVQYPTSVKRISWSIVVKRVYGKNLSMQSAEK